MSITVLEIGPVGAPLYTFESDDGSLVSAEYTGGVGIIGIRLTVDTGKVVVDYPFNSGSAQVMAGKDFSCVVSSDGYVMCSNKAFEDIKNLPYGTEARLYRRGSLFLKFYKKQVTKLSGSKYSISFISSIGILENQNHYGGFYTKTTFAAVLSDIIGGSVPFAVSPEVAKMPVQNGYLPYASKRSNLHDLTFAYGVMIGRNESGDMDFRFLSNASQTQVSPDDFYDGGDIQDPDGVTVVDVTEHGYIALESDETVVVYDNTDGSEMANNTFVDFKSNAPLHDLTATGSLVINSSGANWAIISGIGVLSGKKYTHSSRVLSKYVDKNSTDRSKVVEMSKNTMVTALNSENVAARLLEYYSKKQIVKASMVIKNQKLGDLISGIDPFGESISGFLSAVNGIISTKIKGACEFVSNYIPTGQGSNYSHFVILTGSGNWNIPQSVRDKVGSTIQATISSGGHGGFSGTDGEKCMTDLFQSSLLGPGEGGKGGEPGPGGRVLTVTIEVGDIVSIPYNCGAGGESDTDGEDTTFGTYSSASGVPAVNGIINIISGDVLAIPGTVHGVDGGRGSTSQPNYTDGAGNPVFFNGQQWNPGAQGKTVREEDFRPILKNAVGEGGFGGGAAVGADGGDGGPGWFQEAGTSSNRHYYVNGGDGGKGADAIPGADASVLGGGGQGGHGGGGGGETGRFVVGEADNGWFGDGGAGGKGSKGGKGGDGFILIYY